MTVTPGPPTPSAPTPSRHVTARDFFAVLFRRKWLILGLFGVTTLTVFLIAASTPLVYLSVGRVLVKRGEKESALAPNRQLFSDWEQELGSEIEIVKSWDVIQAAQQILAAEPGPHVTIDPQRVGAEVVGKSNALAIDYEDRNAATAQRVADAMIRAYIDFRQHNLTLGYPRGFFDREIADAQAQLARTIEARRQFANASGVVDVGQQRAEQLNMLELLSSRRSDVTAELAEARAQQQLMRSLQQNPSIDLPTLGQQFTNEEALVDIKRHIVEQETKIAEMRERYRDDSPEVIAANATLDTLRSLLRREVDARLQVSGSRIQALDARRASLEKEITGVQTTLASMPDKQARIDAFDGQIAMLQKRCDDLLQKSRDAKVTEFTSMPVNVLLLSPASPAAAKNTRDYVRLSLAPAFSIVVGVSLAFFVDGLDLTVRTAGQAEEAIDVPVLATLPDRRRRMG